MGLFCLTFCLFCGILLGVFFDNEIALKIGSDESRSTTSAYGAERKKKWTSV